MLPRPHQIYLEDLNRQNVGDNFALPINLFLGLDQYQLNQFIAALIIFVFNKNPQSVTINRWDSLINVLNSQDQNSKTATLDYLHATIMPFLFQQFKLRLSVPMYFITTNLSANHREFIEYNVKYHIAFIFKQACEVYFCPSSGAAFIPGKVPVLSTDRAFTEEEIMAAEHAKKEAALEAERERIRALLFPKFIKKEAKKESVKTDRKALTSSKRVREEAERSDQQNQEAIRPKKRSRGIPSKEIQLLLETNGSLSRKEKKKESSAPTDEKSQLQIDTVYHPDTVPADFFENCIAPQPPVAKPSTAYKATVYQEPSTAYETPLNIEQRTGFQEPETAHETPVYVDPDMAYDRTKHTPLLPLEDESSSLYAFSMFAPGEDFMTFGLADYPKQGYGSSQ